MLWTWVLSHIHPAGAARLPAVDPSSTQELLVPLAFCGSTRTIFNIVWSCLATVFVCTWVAIHPNVPRSPEAWWKMIARRATFMICAIIAPELILWWALRQWKGAKAIQTQFQSYADGKKTWTLTHAHFLQMGGFVICDHYKTPLEVLSPHTLTHLLSTNQISLPNVTEQEIWDKSKGDAFAKAAASFQILWFVVQIIARATQKLPVSELEIVTLGYAILNGIAYFLWWSKPLNVACPIPILLQPGANFHQTLREQRARFKVSPELPSGATGEKDEYVEDQTLQVQHVANFPKNIFDHIPYPLLLLTGLVLVPLIPALALALFGTFLAIAVAIVCVALAVAIPFLILASIILGFGCVTRALLFQKIYNIGQMMFTGTIEPGAPHVPPHYAYDPTPRGRLRGSHPLSNDSDPEDGRGVAIEASNPPYDDASLPIWGALSILFGAIHCIAWSFHFTTTVERITWRICALLTTFVPLVYIIDPIIRTVSRGLGLRLAQKHYVGLALVLCWNVYAAARLVLLTLAVVGLRSMPLDMFLTVRWVDFVPHY